ncbi:MAG: leucine-rich repeat protein [Prevotella sp.]|nr:leucine-rich repeat protein [Prevotella sp.]
MKTKKLLLVLLLITLPFVAHAQYYYSGKVGETISLSKPSTPAGYNGILEMSYSTGSDYLSVYSGTSSVKILSYFSGTETVTCDYTCYREVYSSGRLYYYYGTFTAYYYINCSSTAPSQLVLSASPNGGEVAMGTIVELSVTCNGSEISGCDIYYTLNGSNPSKNSQSYNSGITINSNCTLKAVAYKDGYQTSNILTCKYTISSSSTSVTVSTSSAGTLSSKIGSSAWNTIKSLTVIGEINGTDIFLIRKMIQDGKLEDLNLYSAIIVSGGESYDTWDNTTSNFVIGVSMFSDCSNLKRIRIPLSTLKIDRMAFWGCSGLTSITIPDGVKTIGSNAFFNCRGLTSIKIPKSVTNVANGAFDDCSGLTSISVADENTKYDSRNNCNAIIHTASNKLIAGCKNTIIPSNVTSIEDYAFSGCRMTSITIPNSVKTIGSFAFSGCFYLSSIAIPNSVTSIKSYAFSNCSSLTFVISNIQEPFAFGNKGFSNISSNCKLTVPYGTRDAYIAAGWTTDVFKGGIVEMRAEDVLLDESSTEMPEAVTDVKVIVRRTINAGEWGTICLPFAMTEAQVKAAFGDDVQLGDFNDYEVSADGKSISVKFNAATAIAANHPYIIKVVDNVSEFTADGVDIDPEEEPMINLGSKRKPHAFIGNYVAGTLVDNGCLFLSGGNFWYSVGTTKIKAFRAYFNFDDLLPDFENNYAEARMQIVFTDEQTGITEIISGRTDDSEYYDMQGRRVVMPAHGVYVKDGRKIIVK